MLGYPNFTSDDVQRSSGSNTNHGDDEELYNVLMDLEHYGLGDTRSRSDYLEFAEIDLQNMTCGPMKWCSDGTLE